MIVKRANYDTYTAASKRAKDKLREAIQRGDVPKPTECDGCGKEGMFRQYHYSPLDPYSFSSYCGECWKSHVANSTSRLERYEEEISATIEYRPDPAPEGFKWCSGVERDEHLVLVEAFRGPKVTRCRECENVRALWFR